MSFKLTQQVIQSWGGLGVYREAEELVKRGAVLRADVNPPWIEGVLARSTGELRTKLKVRDNGTADSHCPCFLNQTQGLICAHVVALALTVLKRSTDPLREQKYQEEQRRARRVAAQTDGAYVARNPRGIPAQLLVTLPENWAQAFQSGRVSLACALIASDRAFPPNHAPAGQSYALSKPDDNLLAVLEDIGEGAPGANLEVNQADFLNILDVSRNRALAVAGGGEIRVSDTPMQTRLRLDLDRENGELIVCAHTELPFAGPTDFPVYLVHNKSGWACSADHLWPLERVLPLPYHGIYSEPIAIPRSDVIRFLRLELPLLQQVIAVECEVTTDLFAVEPGLPQFHLVVRGSPASVAAELHAAYGARDFVACGPDTTGEFTVPDPDDLLHYWTRNLPVEEHALKRLGAMGFKGDTGGQLEPIAGTRAVLNFLGSDLPALRRLGWKVRMEGKVATFCESMPVATPVVHVSGTGESGWFDVGMDVEDPTGSTLSPADIQRALLRNDSYVERNGQTILIDRDAIASMRAVFDDCKGREGRQSGHFTLPAVYASFVQASLAAIDGIDVEEPPDWRQHAARQNREAKLVPTPLGDRLEGILRPYQKEGVYWLRFLEEAGFSGLLADEMGLGKTLQTLTWLQLARSDPAARGKPALIVCPTSLVENWNREAALFVPELRRLVLSGARRHELWDEVPRSDLVFTSYALLRRDLDRYLQHQFAVAVLDEAQHIKNRSTQNAVAAKQIQAHSRLVLTGTPLENSVADLWSIMDYLMPDYLGDYESFRAAYEQPISHGDRDGEVAQAKLRRKLHPFLLRRVKREVAKDLPDKIEKVSFCVLSADQQKVYNVLLQESRRKIGDLVQEKGFSRCRMEILAILMKLRQVCCHLELLKSKDLADKAESPSAKLEQFLELLDEAMDGGHRMLVFSQFVSMLHIIRRELEARGIPFCYLDGQTHDRMEQVQRFNLQHDIPLFLISLKAGGTGLNLTGADMVVHFDPWWNPAVEDQATDRAHRIGQRRTVYSIKLIAEHTVEEKVLALQQRKQAVIRATIGASDEAIMQNLTLDDIQDLLNG
jgi:superfamily II DNA or RNA helicase